MTRLLRQRVRLAEARATAARAVAVQAQARLQRTADLRASYAPKPGLAEASVLMTHDRFASRLGHACVALSDAAANKLSQADVCLIATRRAERALDRATKIETAHAARCARRRTLR